VPAAAAPGRLRAAVGEAGDGVVLALGPGSLALVGDGASPGADAPGLGADAPSPGAGDGALPGRVVTSGFRRGVVETVVDVVGVGEVTVVVPSGALLGEALPTPGTEVRVRPDPAAIAVVPD